MPSIKFDFFQVILPTNCIRTFEAMIHEVAGSTDDETRTVENYDGSMLRFQNLVTIGDSVSAEMLRIKMTNLPSKAHLSGRTVPFDLTDEEGTGESTFFLYNEKTKTIVVHKSANGVAPGAIRLYFG